MTRTIAEQLRDFVFDVSDHNYRAGYLGDEDGGLCHRFQDREAIWHTPAGLPYCDLCFRQSDNIFRWRKIRRARGLCHCGLRTPAPGKKRCKECIARTNRVRDEHIAAGRSRSGNELAPGSKMCRKCQK